MRNVITNYMKTSNPSVLLVKIVWYYSPCPLNSVTIRSREQRNVQNHFTIDSISLVICRLKILNIGIKPDHVPICQVRIYTYLMAFLLKVRLLLVLLSFWMQVLSLCFLQEMFSSALKYPSSTIMETNCSRKAKTHTKTRKVTDPNESTRKFTGQRSIMFLKTICFLNPCKP